MIPIKLEMINFISHGNSEVVFDFSSALIVGEYADDNHESNGAGKSSIFKAICWVLFGNTKSKYSKSVIKDGRETCKVTFHFEHEGKEYLIVRSRTEKNAYVDFFEIVGEEKIVLTSDTTTKTNQKICEILSSNYEVFTNSSYFQQGIISSFLDGNTSERQKIISSILNLDRWNNYMKAVDSDSKEIKQEIKTIKSKLEGFEDVEKDLEKSKKSLKEGSELFKIKGNQILESEGRIKSLELKLANLSVSSVDIATLSTKKRELSDKNRQLLDLKDKLEKSIRESSRVKKDIEQNLESINICNSKIEELSPSLDIKKHLDISALEAKMMKGYAKRDTLEAQIKLLSKNDECYACGQDWGDENKKSAKLSELNDTLDALESKILSAEAKIKSKKETLNKVNKIEDDIKSYRNKIESYVSNNNLHELRLSNALQSQTNYKTRIEELTEEIAALESYISNVESTVDSFSTIEAANKDLEKETLNLKKLNSEKEDLIYQVSSAKTSLEYLEKSLEKKVALKKELKVKTNELQVCNDLIRSFGRNGIQAIIIDNVVEELSKETNNLLNKFANIPTYVNFITQKQDSKGGWKETFDVEITTPNGVRDFDMLSGGEAFRVAFAVRLALSKIQSRRMGGETQLLLLDEVSTALDKKGLESFVSIIRSLEKELKVMVITHDDNLKEEFDHIIMVKNSGGNSSIEQL